MELNETERASYFAFAAFDGSTFCNIAARIPNERVKEMSFGWSRAEYERIRVIS